MLGWAIFKKSITQIIFNFGDAFKITGILWIISSLIFVAISYLSLGQFSTNESLVSLDQMPSQSFMSYLVIFIGAVVTFVFSAWIAVLWHRFILIDEHSTTSTPKWHGTHIWAYIVKSIQVGFIMLGVTVPGVIAMAIIIAIAPDPLNLGAIEFLLLVMIMIGFAYVMLRIGLVLPAIALEKPLAISESWDVTKPFNIAILIASALLTTTTVLFQQIGIILVRHDMLHVVYGFFSDWVILMLGIAILTTLYGHLVEKRDL